MNFFNKIFKKKTKKENKHGLLHFDYKIYDLYGQEIYDGSSCIIEVEELNRFVLDNEQEVSEIKFVRFAKKPKCYADVIAQDCPKFWPTENIRWMTKKETV